MVKLTTKSMKKKLLTMCTPEFNNLTADVFNVRLTQANLITKTDFAS